VTDWADVAAKTLPAVVPLITALFAATRGPNVIRSRIKHDAEVVEKLPDSEARTELLDLLRDEVDELRLYNQGRRNLPTLAMAFVAALATGYLTVWLARQGAWWELLAIPSGFLTVVLVYGVFESAQRVPRDEKGKRLSGVPPSRRKPEAVQQQSTATIHPEPHHEIPKQSV
jgi:hypothetical protein